MIDFDYFSFELSFDLFKNSPKPEQTLIFLKLN